MNYCKLQIGCLVILIYIAFIYCRECKKYHRQIKKSMFAKMLLIGSVSVLLDGITAYTVNQPELIETFLNMFLHMLFLISLDSIVFMMFIYMLYITGEFPSKRIWKTVLYLPYILNVIMVIANINTLDYVIGTTSNYSMGLSAYSCFAMVIVYSLLSMYVFFRRWNYIERHKRANIFTYLFALTVTTILQMIFPEILITSIAVTILIVGVYMNQEDPALEELKRYHNEMIMGFTTLIEERDSSTGGHIKRTSMYVKAIALKLKEKKTYADILTKDYIENMIRVAPMHDIGKVSIPDAILQKPGKLTSDEYEQMKKHTTNGGKIIEETFKNFGDEEYLKVAYNMACYHHEKWNGLGYPEGLKAEEIPLCARIMAVADVFDAVSEKRCYRDELPLDECFKIIENGKGTDFDPEIVSTFLAIKDEIINIHMLFKIKK